MKSSNSKLPGLPVRELELSNGLKVFTFQVPGSGRVVADLWFGVGSKHESPEKFGISHFLEHMVFKGNDRYPPGSIDRITTSAGGYNNAATHSEYTHYYFVMPGDKLKLALELLLEMCIRPSLDEIEFDRERQVVLEEMKQYSDHPLYSPYLKHQIGFYEGTPWGHNTLGTEEALAKMTPRMMRRYHSKYYRPGLASLVLAGSLPKKEKLTALLQNTFKGWKGKGTIPSHKSSRGIKTGEHREIYPGKVESVYGFFSLPAPGGDLSRKSAVLSVLTYVLSGTFSSRLSQALLEKTLLCQDFELSSEDTPPANSLLFRFVTDVGAKVPEIIETYKHHLHLIAREPPTWDELTSAKAAMIALRAFGSEDVTGASGWLGDITFPRRRLSTVARYLDYIERTTPDDLSSLASGILSGVRRTALTISYPEDDAPPDAPGNLREYFEVKRKAPAPARASRDELPRLIGKLDAGPAVYGWHVPRSNTLSIRLNFPYNVLAEPLRGMSRIVNLLFLKGTKNRSAVEISKLFERVGANIGPSFSATHMGLAASLLPVDWRLAVETLPDVLAEAAYPRDEVKKAVWEAETKLLRVRDQNHSLAWEKFSESFFPRSPYGVQVIGTPEDLSKIRTRALRSYARSLLDPAGMTIFVAGNYDEKALLEELETQFGRHNYKGAKVSPPREGAFKGKQKRHSFHMDKEQSLILVGFPAAGLGSGDSGSWQLFNCILGVGANSRLFRNLRSKRSLAYSVHSTYFAGLSIGCIVVTIFTSSKNLDEAWSGIFGEVRSLVETPPSKAEFGAARRYLAHQLQTSYETSEGKAGGMAKSVLLGLSPDFPISRAKEIGRFSYDNFRDFLKLLKLDQWGAIHVGPEASQASHAERGV